MKVITRMEMTHVALVPGGFELGYRATMTDTKQPFFWGGIEYVGEPAVILGEPGIDSDVQPPDSEELAALYEARALAMEHEAADARTPAQQEGHRLGASAFRRKAQEMRRRLAG